MSALGCVRVGDAPGEDILYLKVQYEYSSAVLKCSTVHPRKQIIRLKERYHMIRGSALAAKTLNFGF